MVQTMTTAAEEGELPASHAASPPVDRGEKGEKVLHPPGTCEYLTVLVNPIS